MQILSLLAAIVVGILAGVLNGFIGMQTGYDATSLFFYFILPLGAAFLGFLPGFAAGLLDASHKGQSERLPFVWGALGGAVTIIAYYMFFYVQSGAVGAGAGIGEYLTFLFEGYEMGAARAALEFVAAIIGGAIGVGVGTNSARNMAGTRRIPDYFDSLADVLVAMIAVDGSIDDEEKTLANFGMQIALERWFGEPSPELSAEINAYSRDKITERVDAMGDSPVDIDECLATLKARGETLVNITCIGVFSVAAADDVIDPAEETLLRDIVSKLGLPAGAYDEYLTVGKRLAEAFIRPEGNSPDEGNAPDVSA